MKKIFTVLTVVFGLFVLAACSQDHLNIAQKSVESYDDYFDRAGDEEALSLLAAVYYQFRVIYQPAYTIVPNEITGDVAVGGSDPSDGVENHQISSLLHDAGNTQIDQMWGRFYVLIYRANLIVDKIKPDTEVKKRIIAEAKVARAWAMTECMMLWGTPPLVTHVLENAADFEQPNCDPAEAWAWIEQNYTEAAEVLPSKNGKGGQAAIGGRFTREAALGFLGKAQVYQGKYEEARTTLKKVIDSNLYELEPDITKLFHVAADFSPEYLFELDIDYTGSDRTTANRLVTTNTWQNPGWRTDQIYVPLEFTQAAAWGYMNPSKGFALELIKHDGMDSPRRKYTILTYDELLDENNFNYNADQETGMSAKGVKAAGLHDNAGYLRYKFTVKAEDLCTTVANYMTTFLSLTNIPLLRYADILLLYAETCAKTGNDTQAGLDALNLVRSRAGLAPAPALDMDNETYGVKAERRFELFFECANRYIDLVRWGDFGTVYNRMRSEYGFGAIHYRLMGLKDDSIAYGGPDNWIVTEEAVINPGTYSSKFDLLPFPDKEIQNNRNLVQNPGF